MTELNDGIPKDAGPEEVAAYRTVARVLKAASPLNRATCPGREDLIASKASLGSERASARQTHLDACPLCREDLHDLAALTGEPAPSLLAAATAAVRAKVVLALDLAGHALELIESTLTPAPPPALAAARGEGRALEGLALRAPFGEGDLELQWIYARGAVDLLVQALGDAPKSYRLTLRRPGGGIYESRTSDEGGVTRLSGLEPATYALGIYPPQARHPEIQLELDLRGEGS